MPRERRRHCTREITRLESASVHPGLATVFRQLVDEGQAVLLIEQNLHFATRLCERILVMVNGSIAADLPASQLAGDVELQNRYLGVV